MVTGSLISTWLSGGYVFYVVDADPPEELARLAEVHVDHAEGFRIEENASVYKFVIIEYHAVEAVDQRSQSFLVNRYVRSGKEFSDSRHECKSEAAINVSGNRSSSATEHRCEELLPVTAASVAELR